MSKINIKNNAIVLVVLMVSLIACSSDEDSGPQPSDDIVVSACTNTNEDSTRNMDGSVNYINALNGSPTYWVINDVRSDTVGNPIRIDYMVHEPTGTPNGIVFLIRGGSLHANITGANENEAPFSGGDRLAPFYKSQGYRVITMDRPDDYASFNSGGETVDSKFYLYDYYRVSMQHAVDIASIIQRENTENFPVFLLGISRGAISVAANNTLASGVSMLSSLTRPTAPRIPVGSGSLPASVFERPVHMMIHQQDTCNNTLPSYQRSVFNQIANIGIDIKGDTVTGGFTDPAFPRECGLSTFHGYLGIESCAAEKIIDGINVQISELEALAPGNTKPVGMDMTVSNTTTFNVMATDADGDTLVFAVPSSTTTLGGTIAITSAGVATYQAPNGLTGTTDKFAFSVTDGKGGVGLGVVSITI